MQKFLVRVRGYTTKQIHKKNVEDVDKRIRITVHALKPEDRLIGQIYFLSIFPLHIWVRNR